MRRGSQKLAGCCFAGPYSVLRVRGAFLPRQIVAVYRRSCSSEQFRVVRWWKTWGLVGVPYKLQSR